MNAITGIDGMSVIELARLNGNAGLVLGNTILAAPDSLPPSVNFSVLSADYIDQHCPYTSWTVSDPLGGNIQYTLPKFMVFMNLFEKVTVPMSSSPDLVIDVDQGPGPLGPHKVYLGFAIACSNLVVRPAFLAPDLAPAVDLNGNRVIRSYEQDFDYFCLRFQRTMSSADLPSWYCATGNLADGVTGLASKPSAFDPTTNSPATFFLNQIQWGPNVWNKHWEFPHGLGAVATRIPLLEQSGFAKDYQWNLNPNDWHASGVSKVGDYIAAVAVKTATNRNGVNISPYNTRHVFDRLRNGPVTPSLDTVAFAGLVDPGELNQGEVEKRSCDKADPTLCFSYYNKPDVASTGTIGQAGLGVVDLSVGPDYANNLTACSWKLDWGFPALGTFTGGNVQPPPLVSGSAAAITLANSDFRVAANLGDNELPRCPSWNLCQTSGPQPVAHLYAMDASLRVLSIAVSGVNCPASQIGVNCSATSEFRCKQIPCGRQIQVVSGQLQKWWVRSVPSDLTPTTWKIGCSNTDYCAITATENLTIVAVPISVSDSAAASALSQQALP